MTFCKAACPLFVAPDSFHSPLFPACSDSSCEQAVFHVLPPAGKGRAVRRDFPVQTCFRRLSGVEDGAWPGTEQTLSADLAKYLKKKEFET